MMSSSFTPLAIISRASAVGPAVWTSSMYRASVCVAMKVAGRLCPRHHHVSHLVRRDVEDHHRDLLVGGFFLLEQPVQDSHGLLLALTGPHRDQLQLLAVGALLAELGQVVGG